MPAMTKIPQAGQRYKHWKYGKQYEVLCLAKDDDREEILVIHQGLEDGVVWARPLANFMGLNLETPRHPRFTLVEDEA